MLKYLTYLLSVSLLLTLWGCTDDVPHPVGGSMADEEVTLVLQVGVSAAAPQTRADYPDGCPYEFEDASSVYEGVNQLRVIIVNEENIIERNSVFTFADKVPVNGDTYGPMFFKLKPGQKRVYLIANEQSIKPSIDFLGNYTEGSEISQKSSLESKLIYTEWPTGLDPPAVPYIDNMGSGEKEYVPLTEFFDIEVKKPATAAEQTQSAKLFLTRSLVKFSFYIDTTSATQHTPGFRIKNIEFSNVMQKSYLLPYKTVYRPSKYANVSGDAFFKRIITEFETPGWSGNLVSSIKFNPTLFGYSSGNAPVNGVNVSSQYAPQQYYCETINNNRDNEFYIKYVVEWDKLSEEDSEAQTLTAENIKLPNLPMFPRNTHVKVIFKINNYEVRPTVILMPYIGVWLDPVFGIGGEIGPQNISPLQ